MSENRRAECQCQCQYRHNFILAQRKQNVKNACTVSQIKNLL